MSHEKATALAAALVGALVLAGAPALPQHREYYVRGKVVDEQKAPVQGVEIELKDKATSRSYSIKSDKQGVFKLAGLPHGVYAVTFTREGYAPKQDEWKLDTPQERMQRVDVPDVVLVSQAKVQEIQTLKETEAAVKAAAERLRQGDADAAIAGLSGLLEKRPDDVNALFLLGLAHVRKQMYREALVPLTRVTEQSPGFAGAWLEIGVCQRKLGATPMALAAYEKALQLDPQNADAAYNAGLLLFESDRVDEALARFEQGLALKPADPDLLDMAGRCYVHRQKVDRAVELLEKARAVTTDPAKAAFLDELVRKIKPQASRVIIGYVFPQDRLMDAVEIDAAKLTHVNYAFANIASGEVVEGFAKDAENLKVLTGLRATHPGFKVLVSVGGWTWSGGFSEAAATPGSRARFVASAVDFVRRHDLDGFDVDWEYPGLAGYGNPHGPQDKANFTRLMAELREALDADARARGRRALLTMAAGAFPRFLDETEMGEVAKSVDFVNLMTYDFRVDDPVAGHHANLHPHPADDKRSSADGAVRDFLAAGVPASKLVLGVPFYGRAWLSTGGDPGAHGLYQPGTRPAERLETGYEALARDRVDRNGFARHWDPIAQAPYLWSPDARTFVTYEDPESLRVKCRYVRERGLAGVMFWEYFADRPSGVLLTTLFEELRAAGR
jgi:chitinase